jgi:hypothetical protein
MIGVAEKGRDFAAALRLGTGDVASIRAGLQMSIFAARLQKKIPNTYIVCRLQRRDATRGGSMATWVNKDPNQIPELCMEHSKEISE